MAENPYVNKVQTADGSVIMDISNDTVTPSNVLNGATFHDRSGTPQTGSVITHNVYDGLDSTSTSDALSANQGKVLNGNITTQFNTEMADLNTPLNSGRSVITFNNYTTSASNKPTGNSGFIITLGTATYRQQVAFDLSGEIYTRYYNNGTITAWVKRST